MDYCGQWGSTIEGTPDGVLAEVFRLLPFSERLSVVPLVCKAWNRVAQKDSKVWQSCCLDSKDLMKRSSRRIDWRRAVSWLARVPTSMEKLRVHGIDFRAPDVGVHVLPLLLGILAKSLLALELKGCRFHSSTWDALPCLQILKVLKVELPADASEGRLDWETIASLSGLKNLRSLTVHFSADPYRNFDERNVDGVVSIGFPQRLQELRLHRCGKVDAVFATGAFANWSDMRVLSLLDTDVRCMPEAVSSLTRLEYLSLNLAGSEHRDPWKLPYTLTTLTCLKCLELEGHGFRSFPVGVVSKMTWLEDLDLTGIGMADTDQIESLLRRLIPELGLLVRLGLQLNSLTRVPGPLLPMNKLTRLDLRQNRLESLPPGPYVENLVQVMLADNRFVNVPTVLRDATGLELLDLEDNPELVFLEGDVEFVLGMACLRYLGLGSKDKRWSQESTENLCSLARRADSRLKIDFCR
ncbi:unnamed protein product [Ostreobium quekettii]|uniref:F-box domain-containing protein n=1 Tax=Ostreobium quekettii TaxID=121088 RepID=A0A8S1J8U9_9CHLO|nr:unnamed protein product [Ostreobium quekettii]|eukprot:evm.model.scf_1227.1 EVM.evm.TU.scf_1227.1   scf_1227:933-4586(-)